METDPSVRLRNAPTYYPNRDGESLTSPYRWRKENPELDRHLRESAEAQRKDTSGTLQGEG